MYDKNHAPLPMIIIQSPVKITGKAVSEIRRIMESKNLPDHYGLRVGVRDAGTPSVSYVLGFDVKKETDNEYGVDGIPVYIDRAEILPLAGMTVDYHESQEARGFTFLRK